MSRDSRGRPVKSREAEKEGTKSGARADDKEAPEREKAHDPKESPVPKDFGEAIRAHDDRLAKIEDRLGIGKKADDMKNQDQREPKSGSEAGDSTVKKGPPARKRH